MFPLYFYKNLINKFLLDQIGDASVAYSLRKISASSTNAIRVRRDNDHEEQDIGFVGRELDTVSLLSFVGANNGYVTTWYDQSENGNHATQSTADNQPRIVNAGVVQTSKVLNPCILFDGVNDKFTVTLPSSTDFKVYTGNWSDVQDYTIKTPSSGDTYLPAIIGDTLVILNYTSLQLFNNLKRYSMSDEISDDLFRLYFSTSGVKALSITAFPESGISYVDKSGTQVSTNYSGTVDAYDWFIVRATDPTKITQINWASKNLTGCLPKYNFAKLINLANFYCYTNQLTGNIPDLSNNINLVNFSCGNNQLTGNIPDLSNNIKLVNFSCGNSQLTGNIPDLSNNINLANFYCGNNQLTGYVGGIISPTLINFIANNNLLTESAVNTILSKFVSAGASNGTLNLGGTGNASPTGQGLTDKATLQSRGWNVTTN